MRVAGGQGLCVLHAGGHGGRRGGVGGWRGWSLCGSGHRRGNRGGHEAAVLLLGALTPQGEASHGAAPSGRAGAGGGRAGLAGWGSQAGRRCGQDHRDGLALTAPQREADGLLGGLLGTKARTAVHSHQRAHDHKGNEDAAHHQEGHINGLCERITYKSE